MDLYNCIQGGLLSEAEKLLGKPWTLIAAVALGYPATEGRTPPKLTVDEVTEFLE